MEGCFAFQWEGGGVVFQMGKGASFLSGVGGIGFDEGVQKKIIDGRGGTPLCRPTMTKPVNGDFFFFRNSKITLF